MVDNAVRELADALAGGDVEISDAALDSHPHGRQKAIADYLRAAGWPVLDALNGRVGCFVERGRLNVMRNARNDGFIYQWLVNE